MTLNSEKKKKDLLLSGLKFACIIVFVSVCEDSGGMRAASADGKLMMAESNRIPSAV